ncbi:MAG: histidinol-phosphatase [Spirochaetia bacterium]|jgi:histidinol-phosphatase (PHP family)|nr:histidinol-phosphatase [Spirochaetia bacterium]
MNNFHTHTWRCKHATGTVKDYVNAAKEKGMKVLGMSDHTPLPDNRWSHVRMDMSDLDAYVEEFKEAETEGIDILKGLECEWDPVYEGFYRDEILGERNFDFLIGSVHYIKNDGDWEYLSEIRTAKHLAKYAEVLIATMKTGLFSFIAHPDGFGAGYTKWDSNAEACAIDILVAAEELSIPLEINGYGLRKNKVLTEDGIRSVYPLLNFWELAGRFDIKVICNSDAHRPEDVDASIKECKELADKYNLNVIDDIRG